jgi:hypothetical protein
MARVFVNVEHKLSTHSAVSKHLSVYLPLSACELLYWL